MSFVVEAVTVRMVVGVGVVVDVELCTGTLVLIIVRTLLKYSIYVLQKIFYRSQRVPSNPLRQRHWN